MTKSSDKVKSWRIRFKDRCLNLFNNECNICKYNTCKEALEFHHLDSSKKDFHMGQIRANPKSWELIVSELRKCICVCANCHREIHYGHITLDVNKQYLLEKFVDYTVHEPIISKKGTNTLLNWTSNSVKERVLKLRDIDKLSFTEIGVILGCSRTTISRYYKLYSTVGELVDPVDC